MKLFASALLLASSAALFAQLAATSILPPRLKDKGATSEATAIASTQFNVDGLNELEGYRLHIYHSAQFRSSMPQRGQYWDRVVIETGVKAPQ